MNRSSKIICHVKYILCSVALLTEFVTFVYYECHIKQMINSDFAKNIRHAYEFSKNHTLLLDGWNYGTGAGACTNASFAGLWHSLFGYVYAGYIVANIINVLLFIFFIRVLFQSIGLDNIWQLLWMGIVFVPYNIGIFGYPNMLFYDYGAYSYLVAIPFFAIALLITPIATKEELASSNGHLGMDRLKKLTFPLACIIYGILLWIATFSAGIYIIICGLFPIVICFISFYVSGYFRSEKKRLAFLCAFTTIVSACGLVVNMMRGVHAATMGLSKPRNLESFIDMISTYIMLLYQPDNTPVFSPEGIRQLSNFVVLAFITVFGLFSVKQTAGIILHLNDDHNPKMISTDEACLRFVESACITIFLFNIFVLSMTRSTERYHLIGVIPLMCCACINLFSFTKKYSSSILGHIITIGLPAVVMVQSLLSFNYIKTDYIHQQDGITDLMNQVIETAADNGVDTVFMMGPHFNNITEQFRAYDITRNYEHLLTDDDGYSISNSGFYSYACDKSAFSDKNMIVIRPEDNTINDLPPRISDDYSFLKEVCGYEVWISEVCGMDGQIGYPTGNKLSIDLPCTEGMTTMGELDGQGWLHFNEDGIVLASPGLYSDGSRSYRLSVEYDSISGSEVTLELYRDMTLISAVSLPSDQNEASVEIPDIPGEYIWGIRNSSGSSGVIKQIVYTEM